MLGGVARLQRCADDPVFSFLLSPRPLVGARYRMPHTSPLMFALQLGMHIYDKAGDVVRKFAKPSHPEIDPDHVVTLSRYGNIPVGLSFWSHYSSGLGERDR